MPAESPQQSALRQVLRTMQDPSARALAWSVLSAPLIASTAETKHLLSTLPTLELGNICDILDFLTEEDQRPARLHRHLAQRSSHFLGPYFESLWAYFFLHTNRYNITTQNFQIHHQGKTLGEFDFILWDTIAKQHIHVELAAKFYLQIRNSGVHSKYFPNSTSSWIGPNQIDRLDLKVATLLDKQLIIGEHPIAQTHLIKLGVSELKTRTLLKGVLFPEITNCNHFLAHCQSAEKQNHYGWLRRSDFNNWISQCETPLSGTWHAPDKLSWLAPSYLHPRENKTTSPLNAEKMKQFLTSIEEENRPKMLAYTAVADQTKTTSLSGLNQEIFRLFVTPDDWPSKLLP